MKTNKETKLQWMLDNLSTYDEETADDIGKKELLESVADNIRKEAIYEYNLKRHKYNLQSLIADHLQGLPSWCNIPFANWEILELLRSWGYALDTEQKEDRALANYWLFCAGYILSLFEKENIIFLNN